MSKGCICVLFVVFLTEICIGQSDGIFGRSQLAGDLYGTRSRLNSLGIELEMTYVGETFRNMRGGLNTSGASDYRGNFDLVLTADPERFGLGPGTIYFYAQNGHGKGISEDHAGDAQVLSNLDACYLSQVSEYWIEQLYFNEKLRIKVGKQDSNVDFVAVDYGGIFAGSSAAVIPTIPMPTFPDPGLGVSAFWDAAEWISFGAGFYEGSPDGRTSGFNTAFGNDGGSFTIAQLSLKTALGNKGQLSGTYRFGGWYHSSDFDSVCNTRPTASFAGNHGYYLAFDQMLYREQEGSDQGLGAFFQLGFNPDDDRNEIDRYVGFGLNYTGPFEGRDDDVIGLGLNQAAWSDRVDGLSRETAIEFFYKAQLTESIAVQPDIQYIANPGGDGKDALALGVRFEIAF